MGPICFLLPHVGSHFAPFPARPIVLLLAAGPAECPRVKHVPCYVYWMITLKTMHKNLTACQLVPTWKHLILLSDYLILTSLMCRWAAPSQSQSCALAINYRAHFKKFWHLGGCHLFIIDLEGNESGERKVKDTGREHLEYFARRRYKLKKLFWAFIQSFTSQILMDKQTALRAMLGAEGVIEHVT